MNNQPTPELKTRKRNAFWQGFWEVFLFDFIGERAEMLRLPPILSYKEAREADAKALGYDWQMVGQTLQGAIDGFGGANGKA